MAVDPVWAGVVGTAVGAVAGSAASLLAPLINWRTERQRPVVEKENAKELAEQQHALELSRIARENEAVNFEGKRAQIAVWRNGVAEALAEWTAEDQRSRIAARSTGGATTTYFSVVPGRAWFESLRPHLDTSVEEVDYLAKQIEVAMIPEFARTLFDEIARIELNWGLR